MQEFYFIRDLIFRKPKGLLFFYLADHLMNNTIAYYLPMFNAPSMKKLKFLHKFIDCRGNAKQAAIETGSILKQLRKSVTEVQAEIMEREEKGLIRDPALETAYQDLEDLRGRLQTAQEKMFKFGLYITVYADDTKELEKIETTLRSTLESRLIYIKPALYQQKEGLLSTFPYGTDLLQIHNTLNTGDCFLFQRYSRGATLKFVQFFITVGRDCPSIL
jgi:hypothetical protein